MELQFSDIRGRDAGKTGFVLGHGPSLANHLDSLKAIAGNKKKFKIISCNNIDKFTDLDFDYWMLAQPADDQSMFSIKNAYNRFNSRPKTVLLYTDCLDLTDRSLVKQVLNIDYIGYDQRHFNGNPCTWGTGPGGRHICCQHIIPERKCIQEELQAVTKTFNHYSTGDSVAVHMLALAVITGMNPIYIAGVDLDYSNGYINNDFADADKRISMNMITVNNSPEIVKNILRDFAKIRDMAKNIGVEIYCMDKDLIISTVFNYKPFPGTVEPVQNLIAGGTVNDPADTGAGVSYATLDPAAKGSGTTLNNGNLRVKGTVTADSLKWLPAGYTGKIKPQDEYDWNNYAPEYAKQLEDIQNNDGQEFFITEFDIKQTGLEGLEHDEIVFKNKLHDNWKEIYHQAYRLNPASVFEVGVGGGYQIKNIQKLLPETAVFACDISAEQIKKAKEFSSLSDDDMKNITQLDFTSLFPVDRKYEFVFSHAVVMHQGTANAVAMLRNMARISSKYIMLVEGVANHDKWFELVKATLWDFDFQIVGDYIDYGILLTRKTTETADGGVDSFEDKKWQAEQLGVNPEPYDQPPVDQKMYEFEGRLCSAKEIIDLMNDNKPGENGLKIPAPDVDDFVEPVPAPVKNDAKKPLTAGEPADEQPVKQKIEPGDTQPALSDLGDIAKNNIKASEDPLFIFTEIIGCADVGRSALASFHKHHDHKVHIYTTEADIAEIWGENERHPNNIYIIVPQRVADMYKEGHLGTAFIFAEVFSGSSVVGEINNIVHFDSDVIFRKESLSLIKEQFASGFDIVGSRRCYKNNPANITVAAGVPDAVSTYFYGMKRSFVFKGNSFEQLTQMFLGHNIGLDHEVFDFGDCVTFHALKNGAKIYFLDSNLVGGQDENGSKANDHPANLHMDAGSHLVHFGGAGSGCAFYNDPAGKNESYGKWAVIRYRLFCEIMHNKKRPPLPGTGNTVYDDKGRWVSGNYDYQILDIIQNAI